MVLADGVNHTSDVKRVSQTTPKKTEKKPQNSESREKHAFRGDAEGDGPPAAMVDVNHLRDVTYVGYVAYKPRPISAQILKRASRMR